MRIIEIKKETSQDLVFPWIEKIAQSDWRAGKYLSQLLSEEKFFDFCGISSIVYLLTDENENLISFCTLNEKDDIPNTELTPWIGFVYTFPQYRGKHRIGKLIETAYLEAKKRGNKNLYISTHDEGLYENFGFTFYKIMKDNEGQDSRVYKKEVEQKDFSSIIGTKVKGHIDRPLGSHHPRHPEMIYPINYGYVDGVFAGDGAEQDVYVFGANQPLDKYEGTVIGVYHRLNDCEDKWIVILDGDDTKVPSRNEILDAISFQEQYFMGELYLG